MQPESSISIQDLYPDRFDVDDDEYDLEDDFALNLGAESMAPTPPPEPSNFLDLFSPVAMKRRRSRSQFRPVYPDCNLCSRPALRPQRTSCCGNILCEEHIRGQPDASSQMCLSCGSNCPNLTPSSPLRSFLLHVSSQQDSDSSDESTHSNSRTSSLDRDAYASADSESELMEETVSGARHLRSAHTTIVPSTVDPELAGLAGGILGKVLSIVALTLVYYVLFA